MYLFRRGVYILYNRQNITCMTMTILVTQMNIALRLCKVVHFGKSPMSDAGGAGALHQGSRQDNTDQADIMKQLLHRSIISKWNNGVI